MAAAAEVLIVEDDWGFQEVLEDVLTEEGYSVRVARNGSEALGTLPRIPRPVLILLDVQMPVMDGLTFLYHLRQWPHAEDFEVVVMSAGVSPQRLGSADGGIRAMNKPFDLAEILTLCDEFAGRQPHASFVHRAAARPE